MTAAEYETLYTLCVKAQDEIRESAEWCEDTPAGLLAEGDTAALRAASSVAHRLYMWRRFPRLGSADYLPPLPVPSPQSLHVASDPSVA